MCETHKNTSKYRTIFSNLILKAYKHSDYAWKTKIRKSERNIIS